jgi:hypothetical protein
MKKEIIALIASCTLLLFLLGGCTGTSVGSGCSIGGGTPTQGVSSGSKGLTMEFVDGLPADSYLLTGETEPISIFVNIKNEGRFPEEGEDYLGGGIVYISGFDSSIIKIDKTGQDLKDVKLSGLSQYNPYGTVYLAQFQGNILSKSMQVNNYEPNIQATVCYPYITKAGPNVCIDPNPNDNTRDKVCTVQSQSLSSQGAPVAVTKVEQEASSTKMQFKIYVNNVGGGDVLKSDSLGRCGVSADLTGDDLDEVKLESISVSSTDILASCKAYADKNNIIKLFNGAGSVVCSIDKSSYADANNAYSTLLTINLSYGYRSSISKKIKISKTAGAT